MSQDVVVIESGEGRSKSKLLDAALEEVQFDKLLEAVRCKSGKPKSEFRIIIKPNLAMFFKDKITVTDPELVEYLVDRLHDLGYPGVILGEAQNVFDQWLENRGIPYIAEAAGYRFKTPKKREYKIIDLACEDDLRDYRFPEAYSLSGMPISKYWQEADFRINFAKNKTHEQYLYSLCLKNLLGAIPKKDKHLYYHCRLKVSDVCCELYQQFPVHFNIIDAYQSNHGKVGSRVPNPIKTETIIAGADAILVDWVGAIKMGIDPYLSPLNRKALEGIRSPEKCKVIGSLTPYRGWKNAHPIIADLFFRLDETSTRKRLFWPSSFIVDNRLFPWKKKRFKWFNSLVSLLSGAGIVLHPFFFRIILMITYCRLFFSFMKRSWRTIFNKKQLRRKELPLNLKRNQYRDEDYEELPEFIRPMEEIIEAIPKRKASCHTFEKGGILYYMERDLDFPFDEFVSKVDIGKSLTYMKDYIGGRAVQEKHDAEGRCIHQLERTVFLPQPNLLMLFNGKEIDISKIEWINYKEGRHKIIWKTDFSDNKSATFDTGVMTFERLNCRTRIKILAHQSFFMPRILNWIRLNRPLGLRRLLMIFVYRRYFNETIDNYCSVATGKFEPIGRKWIEDTDKVKGGDPMKLMAEERHLAWLLRVYTVLFAMGGFIFMLFPQIPHFFAFDPPPQGILETVNDIGGVFFKLFRTGEHWKEVDVTIPERFWIFSFFAMMLTISAGCYIASLDVRRYRKVVIPVLVEKFFASFSGMIYFLLWSKEGISWFRWDTLYFPWLLVFLIDFPLFVLLLILFLRAHTGAVPEAYVSSIVDEEVYKPMIVGDDKTIVSIIKGEEGKKIDTLDKVIEEAGFFGILEKYRIPEKEKRDFRVVIKPNFMMTYRKDDVSTYTDPELVEHLVDQLWEAGYTNLGIVESQNSYGNYFYNRDVISVARYVGYHVDEEGKHLGGKYRMVDITKEMVPYDYGGTLGKHFVSPTWRDADFRISFAKNKTHSFCYFTLTIKNIYGTLPVQNKYLEYHKKREFDWPTIETLKHFPVHFGLIDAWYSADGQTGVIADPTPEKTMTIIGGEKLVAVDHQGAKLMGLDPLVSRFHTLAVNAFGNPENKVKVISNIDRYQDWTNVNKFLPELLNVAEESPWVFSHFFMSTFIYANPEEFPLKIKGRMMKWVRQSPVIEWLVDLFYATHRKRYKEDHRKTFPQSHPGGDSYGKI
ncbi:DUF362 domain-containing protein [Thermodesulfobacteriota bacterium]